MEDIDDILIKYKFGHLGMKITDYGRLDETKKVRNMQVRQTDAM